MKRGLLAALAIAWLVMSGFAQVQAQPGAVGQPGSQIEVLFSFPPGYSTIIWLDLGSAQYKNGVWLIPVPNLGQAIQQAVEKEVVLAALLIPLEIGPGPMEVKGERAVIYEVKGVQSGPLLLTLRRVGDRGVFRLLTLAGQEVFSKEERLVYGEQSALYLASPEEPRPQLVIEICVKFPSVEICIRFEIGKTQ